MKTFLAALVAALALPSISAAQAPPTAAEAVAGTAVIPRSALFGNPEKTQARLSPDGKYISFIAPRDGVLNVWVGRARQPRAAKPITNDQKRGIRQHFWAFDNKHVLYIQDEGGDENWHVYAVDVVGRHHEGPHALQGRARRDRGPVVEEARRRCRGPQRSRAEWHDL